MPTISRLLEEDGLHTSCSGTAKFLKKVPANWQHCQKTRFGQPLQITAEIKALVEQKLHEDDETTTVQFHAMLTEHRYDISLRTIVYCQISLGWTFQGSKYFQLIHEVNKVKRLEWARLYPSSQCKSSAMSYGLTSIWCSLKVTDNSAAESGESHLRINRGKFTVYIYTSSTVHVYLVAWVQILVYYST